MEKQELRTKKFLHPSMWMITESIAETLGVETESIFEKNRDPKIVRARYFIARFSLMYTEKRLFDIVQFLYPAITHHSTICYGREKINSEIETYPEIRNEWIQILESYKSKIIKNENNTNSYLVGRIDSHINSCKELDNRSGKSESE
jgi:chromosomal replication initiation ATPase DnaA